MRSSTNEVDSKVASLELNNENFEKNAKKSLSTLELLKKALDFGKRAGSTGLEGLGKAADLGKAGIHSLTGAVSGLSGALDTIKDVSAFTMISNAATKAQEAVEKLLKEVTIEQIGAGWKKYANVTESMQTIMSATSDAYADQETQLAAVTRQMDKLNWFADETAFSLEDMSSSIGKFTANKVDLETAVTAIQGIGTWASKSGASVSDAGRAMYNLSQAIAVGSVKLIDWKSIENANMATSQFKQTAIDTAESLGLLTKVEEGLWKTSEGNEVSATNFNEALKDEWFTSEVLLKSLDKYGNFSVKLNDYAEEFNSDFGAANVMDLIDEYKDGSVDWAAAVEESGVELTRLKEIIADLSQDQYAFGMSAFRAAQETKTWGEAVDYTKEAVSTGWMNTFQILFGQYTEAKKLWSDVSEFFYEVFVTGGEKRNDLLEEAFETTNAITKQEFKGLENKGILSPVVLNALRSVAEEHGVTTDDILSDYDAISQAVNDGLITAGMLQEAYENAMASPTIDNEIVDQIKGISEENEAVKEFLGTLEGYSAEDIEKITFGDHKYTEGYEDLERGLDGVISALGLTQTEGSGVVEALKAMGYFGGLAEDALAGYSDEQLKELGMTDDQIEQFKKLREEGQDLDSIFEELGIDATTGGEHFTQGIHNLMDAILAFKDLLQESWDEYFPALEGSTVSEWLTAFDEGTASLITFIEENETLHNVMSALMSVIDFLAGNIKVIGQALAFKGITVAWGAVLKFISAFKKLPTALLGGAAVFNFFKGVIEGLGINFGDLANGIANLTKKFTTWFKAADPVGKLMNYISGKGKAAGVAVRKWVDAFLKLPIVNQGISKLQSGFKLFTAGFSGHMKEGRERLDEFMNKVDEMGGVRLDNIGDIAKMGKDMFVDWIKTFPGVKTMMDGLSAIWSGLREKLIEAGVPIEKIEGAISGVWGLLKTLFGWAVSGFQLVLDKAYELEQWFLNLPVVQSAITRFGGAFKTVQETFLPFVQGIPDAFKKFVDRVNDEFGGFKLKNIGGIFKAFKEEFLSYIANWDGFKAIKDAFSGFFSDIGKGLSGNETIMGIWDGIKDFINSLKETFEGVELPKSFDDIPRFLNDLREALTGIPNAEGGGVAGAIFNGAKFVLEKIVEIAQFAISHWKLVLGIVIVAYIFKKVAGIFHDIHEYFNAMTKELKARAFMETALGVVLLAGAIWIVAQTFKDLIQTFGNGNSFADNMLHILPGLVAIVAVVGAMAILFGAVSKMNQDKASSTWGVAAAVAAIWLVAHAFIDFAEKLDTGKGFAANMKKIMPALIAMMAVIGMMAVLFGVVGKMNPGTGTTWGIVAAMASLWIIAQAFKDLAALSWDQIKKGMAALATVIGGMVVLMLTATFTKASIGTMFSIAAVIAALAGALAVLAFEGAVNPDGLKAAVAALTVVMLALAVLVGAAGFLKPSMGVMTSLIIIIAGIGALIVVLNHFVGVDKTTEIANSLAKLFGSIALLMIALGVVGKLGLGSIAKGLLAMVGVFVVLAAVMAAIGFAVEELNLNSYIDTGIRTVSNILGSVCDTLGDILEKVKKSLFGDKTPLQALTDDVAYFVDTIGSESFKNDIKAIGDLKLLGMAGINGALITIFTSVIGKEAGVMALFNVVSEWATDKTAITALTDDISYLVATLGSPEFAENIKKIGELKLLGNAGINGALVAILTAIFGAEGAIMKIFDTITSCITGNDETAIQSISNDIKYLADTIGSEEFKTNMDRLGELKLLGESGVNGALVAIFTAIFGAGGALGKVLNEVIGFATGDHDFNAVRYAVNDVKYIADTLGSEEFTTNMENIGNIKMPDAAINELAIGAITAIFAAGGALGTIVDKIGEFVSGDKDYNAVRIACNNVKYLADTLGSEELATNMNNLAAVTFPADKINTLVGLLTTVNMNGLVSAIQDLIVSWLTGDEQTALEKWAGDVETLGNAIGTWNTKMEEAGDLIVDEAAITSLTNAVNSVSKTGGLFGAISAFVTGEKDLGQFKLDAEELGEGIKAFVDGLGEGTDMSKIRAAKSITRDIASISASASQLMSGTFWVDNMGEQLGHVATNINFFADQIADPELVAEIGPSVGSITDALFTFSKIELKGDIMSDDLVTSFDSNLKTIIAAIENTATVDTSGVDNLKSAAETLNSVKVSNQPTANTTNEAARLAMNEGVELVKDYTESVSASSGAAETAASGLASAMVTALSNVTGFYNAGVSMTNAVAAGLAYGAASVNAAAASVGTGAASSMVPGDLWYAGYNFVKGFANGITLYTYVATNAAAEMTRQALLKVKEVMNSNSPSKETLKLGSYFGEGFELGILNRVESVASAAGELGESAMEGLNGAIRSINSVISSKIDDGPVIRPVLDLTEIQNGATSITSMLSAINMPDPFGNFMPIRNSVEAQRQQASLDDVVSALGLVEETTSNIRGGDTYNVNGVTYDDGSNIADAVKTLINATVVQRRS